MTHSDPAGQIRPGEGRLSLTRQGRTGQSRAGPIEASQGMSGKDNINLHCFVDTDNVAGQKPCHQQRTEHVRRSGSTQ